MNKTKKTGVLMAACLMLAVMMFAACVIAGTMAKYTSTGTVNTKLDVALWSFDISKAGTFPQNVVSETVTLSNLSWTVNPCETDGSAQPNENTIAPGTWGYAPIVIQNVGDVDAVVTVDVGELALPTESSESNVITDLEDRLVFAIMTNTPNEGNIDGTNKLSSPYNILDGILVRSGKSGANTITFYLAYKWDFGTIADAENDNKFESNVFDFGTFTITAQQVEPSKG